MLVDPHAPVDAGHGVTRTVLADSPELMLVEFAFAEGGEGLAHSHPHVQSTFVRPAATASPSATRASRSDRATPSSCPRA